MRFFEKGDCNTGRQMFVDVAKVAAIVFMVADHTMMYGGANLEHGLGMLVDGVFGGPLAAPLFMVCMGIGVAYSNRNDAASLAGRGWRMLLASYVFNAVRALAYLPLGYFGGDASNYHLFLHLFFIVDILQFAGMALLLLALLRKLNFGVVPVVLLSLAMSLAGSFVADETGWLVKTVHTDIPAIDFPLALVVGLVSQSRSFPELPLAYSAFPLLNWFVFVTFGLAAGKLIRRCRDLDRLFAFVTLPALLLFVCDTVWGMHGSPLVRLYRSEASFYYLSVVDMLLVVLPAVVFMLGAGHIAGKALKGSAAALVQRMAADLNRIYLIHWVLVMWIVDVLLCKTFDLHMSAVTLLVVSFVVLSVSAALVRHRPFSRFKL